MARRPVGSLIGAIAGLAFVLVNAGAVPLSLVWSIVAAIAFAAISWFVVLRGPEADWPPPSRTAWRTYAISVAVMIVAIPAGATIINNIFGKPNAVPVWVVFVVGAHFQPFANAFQMPVFRWLSGALGLDAVVGAIPAVSSDSAAAAGWTGVVAGFLLLVFSAVGPRLTAVIAATRS
jgi:hypothetical protein